MSTSSKAKGGGFPGRIVSGGQTGADRAALDFAIEHRLEHGGFCPKGRKAEDGPIPPVYQLTETASPDYPERTRRNVELADATVIFAPPGPVGRGTRLTAREAARLAKPCKVLSGSPDAEADAADLVQFLVEHRPAVLNVAGSRESTRPGIGAYVKAVLARSFSILSCSQPDISS